MRAVARLLLGLIAALVCCGTAGLAATFGTVTIQFVVPEYLNVHADLEAHNGGESGAAAASLTITTNQSDWALVAGVEGQAASSWQTASPFLSISATSEDVAVQIDLDEYELEGSPSIAQTVAWRGDELRRTYTVVERGGAGPRQRLRFAYRVHPALAEVSREMGPLRVVYTVVR